MRVIILGHEEDRLDFRVESLVGQGHGELVLHVAGGAQAAEHDAGAKRADEADRQAGERLDLARGWWMKHDPAGQAAVTKWKVLGRSMVARNFIASPHPGRACARPSESLTGEATERNEAGGGLSKKLTPVPTLPHKGGGNLTWLALEPLTGRTHQLRVHCAAMGWPILGDAIYGTASRKDGPKDGSMLHLHAREVVVPLYKNRAPIRVVAPIPAPIRAALNQCGWREEANQVTPPASPETKAKG